MCGERYPTEYAPLLGFRLRVSATSRIRAPPTLPANPQTQDEVMCVSPVSRARGNGAPYKTGPFMEGRDRMTLIRLVVVTVLAICMTCVVADRALAHITQFTINEDADLAPGGLQMAVTGTLVCTADEIAA